MENETNEQKKEQPAVNTGAGVQSETDSIVERAKSERQKLEEAIKQTEDLLRKNEEILAKQILGGRTEAGQQPLVAKEIDPKEYAKQLLNGKV